MVRTETRRATETESLTPSQPLQAVPQPTLFVGLPGALPSNQGLALPAPQVPYGFGWPTAPFGVPYASPFHGFAPLQGIANLPAFFPQVALPVAQAPSVVQPAQPQGPGIPAAIQDLGREVVATFELPGVEAQDLQVVVGNTSVSVQAQRPAANGRVYHGTFQLPAEVLPSQANARLQHGILVLTLPRRTPTEEPRRVPIEG